MAEWARDNGYSKICMVDDDISGMAVRVTPEETTLRKSGAPDREEMFKTVEEYLDWYAHVGVSQRFHNDAYNGEWPIVVENSRMVRFNAYRVKEFLECEHGRISTSEDMDITIQLLLKGYKNCVLYKWTHDQTETGSAGGCSLYRTLDVHNTNIQKLHDLYPEFTKLRSKNNKTGQKGGLSSRLEIVINWEKAYASSQEKLRSENYG